MEYFAQTDIGKMRSKNQDQAVISVNSKDQVLAIVCDGMGGHKAGEIASRVMADHIVSNFRIYPSFSSGEEIEQWILETIFQANEIILKMAQTSENLEGMGTTVVLAVIDEDEAYICHVGDSRAYVLKDGKLKQITKDHSLVNALIDQGAITEEEAKHHSQKNVLLQAIGATLGIKPSMQRVDIKDQLLLLCSDGLYNSLDDKEIATILNSEEKITDKVSQLIDNANQSGGLDNIGIAVVDRKGR